MSLGMELGLVPGDFVLDVDLAPPLQKGGGAPKFSAHVYYGQTAGWTKMISLLDMEIGLSPGDFVLDGDQPLPQKEEEPPPQLSAHFYCGQTAGCIKMPLGMEVGLSLGDFVLDEDPARPLKFRPMFIRPAGLKFAERGSLKIQDAKIAKNSPRAPSHNFVGKTY